MFDHSRATPLPSLFTSWGLTNWLFQIWFSSASTTGFKLKFQQVIGYRALPSQPQTTKRADPISKRIYVGLFVAKLLETLASKGTSRGKGLNPARTATAPKMIKLFLQALPFLSHPPRKQAGSTSRNTPLRHRFCLRYFVPGEVLLQELQTKAKMPSPQASVWIHSSWNKRLLPNWWWKICSKKRASNLFCTHDDRIQRLDLPSSIRRVERAVFFLDESCSFSTFPRPWPDRLLRTRRARNWSGEPTPTACTSQPHEANFEAQLQTLDEVGGCDVTCCLRLASNLLCAHDDRIHRPDLPTLDRCFSAVSLRKGEFLETWQLQDFPGITNSKFGNTLEN